MNDSDGPTLTSAQAYEAAYRFVTQYWSREPTSESLTLLLVAMEPTTDHYRTNDPASSQDWEQCVADTLAGQPLPPLRNRGPISIEPKGRPYDHAWNGDSNPTQPAEHTSNGGHMTGPGVDGGPLSHDDLRELAQLLARYAARDLDQWDNWRIESPHGPVYVQISRKAIPSAQDEAYTTIWPLPEHLESSDLPATGS